MTSLKAPMSAEEIVKSRRLLPSQKAENQAPLCTTCRKHLVRAPVPPLTLDDRIVWTHPGSGPYDPRVEILDEDYRTSDPKKLAVLFLHFHKTLADKREPPGEVPVSGGVGGPIIDIPHDPNYKYEEEK